MKSHAVSELTGMNATGTKLFGCRLPAAFTGGYRRGKIYRGGKRHGSRHGGYRHGKKNSWTPRGQHFTSIFWIFFCFDFSKKN